MHCKEIGELISCMLDHELSAEDSALVTEHVAGCTECMRAFEAFHAVSVAMEELEEVPEGFTAGVMSRVAAAVPVAKKRKPRILRYGALAACLALVLLTGSGMLSTYNGTSQHSSDTAAYDDTAAKYVQNHTNSVAEDTADTDAVTEAPEGTAFALCSDEDFRAAAENEESSSADKTMADDGSGDAAGTATGDAKGDTDGAAANGSADTPAATPLPQPETATLADVLAFAKAADPAAYTENADYTVTVAGKTGDVELTVWIRDGQVVCKNAANEAWIAAGTPEQLTLLLGAAAAPEVTPEPSAAPAP